MSFIRTPRPSLLRPLLRWISLVAAALVLAALSAWRFQQHRFALFFGIVLALAVIAVTVYLGTASADDGEKGAASRS